MSKSPNDVPAFKPLTPKEKIMADTWLKAGKRISKTKAALEAYPNAGYESAKVLAHRGFSKANVQAYLANHDEEAQGTIVEMMQQREDKRLAFDAARDLQDRIHGKAKQQVEVNSTSVSMTIDLTGGVLSPSEALLNEKTD